MSALIEYCIYEVLIKMLLLLAFILLTMDHNRKVFGVNMPFDISTNWFNY